MRPRFVYQALGFKQFPNIQQDIQYVKSTQQPFKNGVGSADYTWLEAGPGPKHTSADTGILSQNQGNV